VVHAVAWMSLEVLMLGIVCVKVRQSFIADFFAEYEDLRANFWFEVTGSLVRW